MGSGTSHRRSAAAAAEPLPPAGGDATSGEDGTGAADVWPSATGSPGTPVPVQATSASPSATARAAIRGLTLVSGRKTLATARTAAARDSALEIHRRPIDRREPSDEAMRATAATSISTNAAAYRLTQPLRVVRACSCIVYRRSAR